MKRKMPTMARMDAPTARGNLQWDVPPRALERWQPNVVAAAAPTDNTISILDPIGADPWSDTGGVTAKRIMGALRSIGPESDVVVNINSPGGDLFEGLAIYSALREHKGDVTVKVLSLAASAASIIAMAGDTIQVARSGFLMIHDTWVVALGNRNDLRDVADTLEPFDRAMADIYAARTGMDTKAVMKLMDAETWIGGADAVDQGFADSMLPSDEVKKDKNARGDTFAAFMLDITLARAGMPRSQRRALLQDFKGGDGSPASGNEKPGGDARHDTQNAVGGTQNAAEAGAIDVLSHLRAFVPSV